MSKEMLTAHFSVKEFRCQCGCGICSVDPRLLRVLEEMREVLGPLPIKSGCRCPKWNRICEGKPKSAHITTKKKMCRAADLGLRSKGSRGRLKIVAAAIKVGIVRIGPHKSFVHVDVADELPEGMWVY